MKRIAPLFAFILVLLTVIASCEKETMLTVDQTSLSFTDNGGSQTITLTANKPWTVKCDQSWCNVSPSAGEEAASSRITITCDANITHDGRSCNITFTCAELSKIVSVSQATNNGLIVSQTSYELTKAAQQLNIQIQANVKFIVDVDNGCKDWIKYNSTKGLSTSTVILDITENKTYDSREGKVTIKQDGGNLSSTVTIKQSQLDGLFITTPEYNLSNEKHTLTVEVSTNVEFDVKPEADWVKYVQTKGLSTKQIVLQVDENETYDQRETKVNVKQKNGDLSGTITIIQDEKYGILVSQPEYSLSNEATTIAVEVKYNVDFEVVIPDECKEWIKHVSTKALNSKTYTFSIAGNETYDNREGSITFKQKNGANSTTISIQQAQTDYLEVAQEEYTVDIEGGIITIDVTSNVEYDVFISSEAQSWLHRVETKGINNNTINIAVAPGAENTDRLGEIYVRYKEFEHRISIHQYSYEASTIIRFEDEMVKTKLIEAFDINKDGELSLKEARTVENIEHAFGEIKPIYFYERKPFRSFDEFRFFTNVTTIPKGMFSVWEDLSSITLPDSITLIDTAAFYSCTSLSSVVIPEGVTQIKEETFCGSGLKTVTLHEGVEVVNARAFSYCSNLTTVEVQGICLFQSSAFMGCKNLNHLYISDYSKWCSCGFSYHTHPFSYSKGDNHLYVRGVEVKELTIPMGITKIAAFAFSNCNCLSSVVIPTSITTIEQATFSNCSRLISVTIPSSVTSIGAGAFELCTSLTNIDIPQSVSSIEMGAFNGCSSLTSIILPPKITSIKFYTFSNCSKLSSVFVPDSVLTIEGQAFEHCTSLSNIVIPDSVTSIGAGAFYGCSALTSIIIPENVIQISDYAFMDCYQLEKIIILPSIPPLLGTYAFSGVNNNCPIYVPELSVEAYKSADGWRNYADRIKAIP